MPCLGDNRIQMEGLKHILFFLSAGLSWFAVAETNGPPQLKKKLLQVAYYKNMFGHIHKNPSRYSQSLSTLECGHPVKIYALEKEAGRPAQELFEGRFRYVEVGPYQGYIDHAYLSPEKVSCFQDKFSKFFEQLNLSPTDMYHWGKLYDHYVYGKSRVP